MEGVCALEQLEIFRSGNVYTQFFLQKREEKKNWLVPGNRDVLVALFMK